MPRCTIALGWGCNNRCAFCCAGSDEYREPSAEEARCLLRAAADDGADELVLTGGEPTLRRDLAGIVREARDLGFRVVQLQTNARMLSYPDLARELVGAGVTEFVVTVAGHTAALHDAQTRSRGSWRQTSAGIANLRRLGAFVAANVLATRAALPHLPDVARWLVSRDVSQVQVAFPEPTGRAYLAMDEVVPRLVDARGPLRGALAAALEAERFATTEGFPLCAAPTYVKNAVEWAEGEGVRPEWEGRAHGAPCGRCILAERCPGMWIPYLDRRGDGELEPVTSCL